jgi:hypothetical protein
MVAHVVETAHTEAPVETSVEAPVEASPIPTSLVAHVVEVTAAPAPVDLESWKKDAFEALNKNVSVHNVVAVPASATVVAASAVTVAAPAPIAEKKTYKIVMIRHGNTQLDLILDFKLKLSEI